jgi:dGTPase
VPAQFVIDPQQPLYNNIQSLVDFVAGMTDLYAVDMYRKITGMTFPELR